MKAHISLIACLYIISGLFYLGLGLWLGFIFFGHTAILSPYINYLLPSIINFNAIGLVITFFAFGLMDLIIGWGVFNYRNWARRLALAFAFLRLFGNIRNFFVLISFGPIVIFMVLMSTLFSSYIVWALFSKEGAALFKESL